MNKPHEATLFVGDEASPRAVKRVRVLRMLLSGQQLSQAQIARRLGLGRPTISGVVAELKERELIEERTVGKPTARGGKPPRILGISGDHAHVLSVWIEGTKIRSSLLSLKGEVRDHEEIHIPRDARLPDDIPAIVARSVQGMRERLQRFRPGAELLSVGVAISGRVDPADGRVSMSINYHMRDFPLADKVRECTGIPIPVFVADYPVVCAFQEYWFGAAKEARNFVFLRVLPFLKAVVFVNGALWSGADLLAGEVGASLAKMGFGETECLCDLIDHDTFGTPELTSKLAFPDSLSDGAQHRAYLDSVEGFISKLDQGQVNGELTKLALIIGQTVRNLVVYYNPELIILDGIPAQRQSGFLEAAQAALAELKPLAPSADCRLAFTEQDEDYKARAIMCMIFERMLRVKGGNAYGKGSLV